MHHLSPETEAVGMLVSGTTDVPLLALIGFYAIRCCEGVA